jgi:hypothetical protein
VSVQFDSHAPLLSLGKASGPKNAVCGKNPPKPPGVWLIGIMKGFAVDGPAENGADVGEGSSCIAGAELDT